MKKIKERGHGFFFGGGVFLFKRAVPVRTIDN